MNPDVPNLAIAVLLPMAVFWGGAWLMARISGRDLPEAARDLTPLNRRPGYDRAAVDRYWAALGASGLQAELRFLKLDLIFPLAYGAALSTALLLAWDRLERPLSPHWLLAPVAITMVADWIENAVQLDQLKRYAAAPAMSALDALQDAKIRRASAATATKLLFFSLSTVLWLGLAVCWLLRLLAGT